MPEKDQLESYPFPVRGIELSTAFDMQPVDSTPAGVNVRTVDSEADRSRGGSRPGLSKFLADRPGGNISLIQHLAVVVDPTTLAMLDNYDEPADLPGIDDPSSDGNGGPYGGLTPSKGGNAGRNPGRRVRTGGSGRQSNKNRFRSSSRIVYRQAAGGFSSPNVFTARSVQLDNTVNKGNLLVLFAYTQRAGAATPGFSPLTVSDSLGSLWERAGNYIDLPGGDIRISMWYAVAESSGRCTITAVADREVFWGLSAVEYGGTKTTSPRRSAAGQLVYNPPPGDRSTGVLAAVGNDVVVAAFLSGSYTPNNGYTRRFDARAFNVVDRVVSVAGDYENQANMTFSGEGFYMAVGAVFKPRTT